MLLSYFVKQFAPNFGDVSLSANAKFGEQSPAFKPPNFRIVF
jgi:hypothetical protein